LSILDSFFAASAQTEGIIVRVAPNFMAEQSDPANNRWFWSYHIRIENHSHETVQLLSRHWKITDARGTINHVDGDGVIGEQPVLKPGQSHDYVSGCPLSTPTGTMEGAYRFVRRDASTFLAAIPLFHLMASTVTQ
jgi:ApaG protein